MQQARVMEANRHLEALVKTWERGAVPLHMDLELTKSQIEMVIFTILYICQLVF